MSDFITRHRATITIIICFMVALFEGVDLQAAGVAAPRLLPLFKLSPQEAGVFFSASTFGLLGGAVCGGWLADRIGRKRVLLASILIFGVFALATVVARDFDGLVGLRFMTGVGLGGALPNMIALASENSPPDRRGFSVGLMYCGMPLGGALASSINLAGSADWRHVFYIGGIAPLILAPALALCLHESKAIRSELAAARGASLGDIWRTLFGEGRLIATVLLWTGFGFSLLVLYLLLNWLPSLLVSRGFSRTTASWAQVAFNLSGVVGSIGVGRLIDSPRRVWTTTISFAVTVIFLMTLAVAHGSPIVTILIVGALGLGVMSNQSLLYALAPWCYPGPVRGTGVGFAVAVGRTGSLIGPLLAGQLLGAGQTAGQVLAHMAPIIVIGALATIILAGLLNRERITASLVAVQV
jgi:AAHS family 3-hydroxyphenylpropionic acid transporter